MPAWAGVLPRVHAWADGQQFGRVELRMPPLSGVSVISQDCDDVFWQLSKAFPIPITD
jgi:hypothetical protein